MDRRRSQYRRILKLFDMNVYDMRWRENERPQADCRASYNCRELLLPILPPQYSAAVAKSRADRGLCKASQISGQLLNTADSDESVSYNLTLYFGISHLAVCQTLGACNLRNPAGTNKKPLLLVRLSNNTC